ncbi:MAG: DUF2191 domain-containing protein [Actinobacteria bacterium]|nr:DUF2191 domain-containing protein [Actinomycetota bacterium]
MKITAIIADEIISEVKKHTKGKNITESLAIALKEWISLKHILELNKTIEDKPLEFKKDFTASKIREINRKI